MLPHTFRCGDWVRFCSEWRPDLLPCNVSLFGRIVRVGTWNVWVSFEAFPDEIIFLGANEVRAASGFEKRKISERIDKRAWTDWESSSSEKG